ncbi:MAG: OmpW family outer membrane protein [Parachlamydiales bacterium]|jgi:hypothetical protein
MHKVLTLLLFFACTFSTVYAQGNYDEDCCIENPACDPCNSFWTDGWSIEGRGAAFIPLSNRFKNVYGDVLPEIQIEINKNIYCDWSIWANVGYLWKNGHSIGLDNKTRFEMAPISLGIKYYYTINDCWKAYLGVGAVYSLLHIHDDSSFVQRNVTKNEFGGVVKLGANYDINCNLYLDIFGDFRFQEFCFHSSSEASVTRNNANLNGFILGVGLGWKFGL